MPAVPSFRGVLLDIEGTTTPISFVYDVLFPFAATRLEVACGRAASSEEMVRAVDVLAREHGAETSADVPDFGDGSPYARYLMENDRKSTGLKKLQGLIWQQGYASGELRGEVFDDVPPALRRWQQAGLRLRVYSSGSVLAQKLLFSTTGYGDLTVYFEGYHDTDTGPKKEAASYRAIAGSYALRPAQILFLSDVTAELDAAAEAGLATGLLNRPGNKPSAPHRHPEYDNFLKIDKYLRNTDLRNTDLRNTDLRNTDLRNTGESR